MTVNSRSLVVQLHRCISKKPLEIIIGFGLFAGAFLNCDIAKYTFYILLLIAQLALIVKMIAINSRIRGLTINSIRYFIIIWIICLIMIDFLFQNVDVIRIINRILPLTAIFGSIICGEEKLKLDIKKIIEVFVSLYLFLCFVIILDYIRYRLTGIAVWMPISYLGKRYPGSFGDPNFMALYSGMVFIILYYENSYFVRYRTLSLLLVLTTIIMSGALSTIILLPISILLYNRKRGRNNRHKLFLIFSIYFIFQLIYTLFSSEFENILVQLLSNIYGGTTGAYVKYRSLAARIDVQSHALQIFLTNIWGQGPLQIVGQLGRDTHNSFIGIIFEQGILGLLLLIITVRNKKTNNAIIDVCGTFVFLSALLLNVHFTSIYTLFLILQYSNIECQKRRLFKGHE